MINFRGGSVVGHDCVPLVVDVEYEVLTLSKGEFILRNTCDPEAINFTITAKPMRPISPLMKDNAAE